MSLGECLNYLFILHSNCNVLYREVTLKKKTKLSDFFKVTQVAIKTTDCVCVCVYSLTLFG